MLCPHAFKLFCELLFKPPKGWLPLGVKQMARPSPMVIRCPEAGDQHAKLECVLKQLGPSMFQPPVVVRGVPNLNGNDPAQQIVDMPVGIGGGFEMMANARPEPAGAQCAADIGIISRDDRERSQPADFQPLHSGGVAYQDIGALGLGQFHALQPKVLAFHTQLLVLTSLRFT